MEKKLQIFSTFLCNLCSTRGFPLEFCNGSWARKTFHQNIKKCNDMSIRLAAVLALNRQTDGIAETISCSPWTACWFAVKSAKSHVTWQIFVCRHSRQKVSADFSPWCITGLRTLLLWCIAGCRHYFALSTNSGEQFFAFTSVAAWLLRMCGKQVEQPQEVWVFKCLFMWWLRRYLDM